LDLAKERGLTVKGLVVDIRDFEAAITVVFEADDYENCSGQLKSYRSFSRTLIKQKQETRHHSRRSINLVEHLSSERRKN